MTLAYDMYMVAEEAAKEAAKKAAKKAFENGFSAGEERGRNEGISIGRNEGISLGAQQKAIETAKTLLAFGDSIEKVSKVTGLSIEEIEKL